MKSHATVILVIGLALGGCAASHPPARQVDYGRTFDRDGAPRSLVLSHPEAAGDDYAWYASRNDFARSTVVERDGLVYDVSVDRVYDRLHTHNGRVHDHYHQSSYRQRVRTFAP